MTHYSARSVSLVSAYRKWIKWAVVIAIVVVLVSVRAVYYYFDGSQTWQNTVTLGDEEIGVSIRHDWTRYIGPNHNHISMVKCESYCTSLRFPVGRSVVLGSNAEPEALWRRGDEILYASRWPIHQSWHIERVAEDGKTELLEKDAWPEAPGPWNLDTSGEAGTVLDEKYLANRKRPKD